MLNNQVLRPKASEKKIRTSDDFELCYLRHQYFRRVQYNPTKEEMQPYMHIVCNLSKNTFFTYSNLFKAIGLHLDDIINIGRVHLVSFLGLYALEKMKDKKKAFKVQCQINNGRAAEEKDFVQKNRANFTMFFKQRMEDLARVCRQKSRNVKGQPSEEYAVFCSKNKPPENYHRILKEHEELGYKKTDFSIFKSIRKKADVNIDATIFSFDDIWYVAIPLEQKVLDIDDLIGSPYNPYASDHNMQPDERYLELPIKGRNWNLRVKGVTEDDVKKGKTYGMTTEEKESDHFKALFKKIPRDEKRLILKNFVAKNCEKSQYGEEVAAARKLLRGLGE
jgi:hypothetical protein